MLSKRLFFGCFIFCALSVAQAWAKTQTVLIDDMLLDAETASLLNNDACDFGARKLSAELWEDGVLPLTFPDDLEQWKKDLFFEACNQWESVANVRCMEGVYKRRTIVVTQSEGLGCFAIWGMGRSLGTLRRWINLAPGTPGCWSRGTITHEIGHALGLIHEHQRPDRDQYLDVFPDNIENTAGLNRWTNFDKQGAQMLTPYDFMSIMHYSKDAFSKNRQDTMRPKSEYIQFLNTMGKSGNISKLDAATMAALYGGKR